MFTQDDVTKADKFAQFVSKARFDLPVTEWLVLHQHLVWYNSLIKKIQENIFEPVKVHPDEPEAAPSAKVPKSKAKMS